MFAAEAEREGPFLNSALLCERVLQEPDGTLSVIRAVDMITVTQVGDPIPENAVVVGPPLRLFLLLSFKGGVLGSKHVLTVTGYSPSGATETFPPIGGRVEYHRTWRGPGLQFHRPSPRRLAEPGSLLVRDPFGRSPRYGSATESCA